MSMLTIRGGGRTVRGAPTPTNSTGLYVGPDGLQGWQGLPPRRRQALLRSLAAGGHDVPVRLPERVITVDPGVIVAKSEFDLQMLCDSVNGWGASGESFVLSVAHLGQTLTATVKVLAADAHGTQRRAAGLVLGTFSVQFVASDPRKYAPVAPFDVPAGGGSVWVPSQGNFPAHPVVEIPNAPSAYTASSPGGTFTVTGVPAGGTHRIDLRTGRVTRDGVWMQGAGRGRLWAVPNGTQWEHTLSTGGRFLLADTYV